MHDPERRAFFLQFGRQAVSAVGQVAGMADVLGRTSSALAGELLGLEERRPSPGPGAFTRGGVISEPVVSAAAPAGEHAYRSAYRLSDEGLVLLDQRRIPEALDEVVARRGSDVAYYLRLGVARGGPLMAQLAAYGLALTAAERAGAAPEQRDLELRRTRQALLEARPSARLVGWAVERMGSLLARQGQELSGPDVAALLRAEAEALAADVRDRQAALATHLAQALPAPEGNPLTVLIHGGQGALAGGIVGAGLSALGQLRDSGHPLRIFLTEGRPFMDGARLGAWELRQAGLDHRVVPDAAVSWLLDREPIDAVLLNAEWIAANGDVGALLGSGAIARLVSALPPGAPRPRVFVSGLESARHSGTANGAAIPVELRPARDLTAYLSGVPVRASDALVPAADVVPAGSIDLLVTESGATSGGAR